MTILTAIIAFIYLCVNIKKLKDKEIIKRLFINIMLIMVISAFFWIPLLETYNFAEYEAYQEDAMATKESFINSGLELKQLFTTSKDSIYVYEIGIHIIIMIILSIFAIKNIIKKEYKKEYILFFILGILSILMSTKYFPWGIFNEKVAIIQFTWRMLVFSDFFLVIICAINMENLIKEIKTTDVIIISIIAILYCMILKGYIPLNNEIQEIDKVDMGNVTESKYEAISGMGKGEYLPVRSNKNRKYILERENTIKILQGMGNIQDFNKNGQKLNAKIEIFTDNTILELPYIYYPGYKVKLNNEKINSFESKNGFIAISINKINEGILEVNYEETIIMKISKGISIIGIIIFILYINIEEIKKSYNKLKSVRKLT